MSAIEILFESNQIIVITKPAGTISEHNKFEADNAEALVRAHLSEKSKNAIRRYYAPLRQSDKRDLAYGETSGYT